MLDVFWFYEYFEFQREDAKVLKRCFCCEDDWLMERLSLHSLLVLFVYSENNKVITELHLHVPEALTLSTLLSGF